MGNRIGLDVSGSIVNLVCPIEASGCCSCCTNTVEVATTKRDCGGDPVVPRPCYSVSCRIWKVEKPGEEGSDDSDDEEEEDLPRHPSPTSMVNSGSSSSSCSFSSSPFGISSAVGHPCSSCEVVRQILNKLDDASGQAHSLHTLWIHTTEGIGGKDLPPTKEERIQNRKGGKDPKQDQPTQKETRREPTTQLGNNRPSLITAEQHPFILLNSPHSRRGPNTSSGQDQPPEEQSKARQGWKLFLFSLHTDELFRILPLYFDELRTSVELDVTGSGLLGFLHLVQQCIERTTNSPLRSFTIDAGYRPNDDTMSSNLPALSSSCYCTSSSCPFSYRLPWTPPRTRFPLPCRSKLPPVRYHREIRCILQALHHWLCMPGGSYVFTYKRTKRLINEVLPDPQDFYVSPLPASSSPSDFYPFLLINIKSGVSFHEVTAPGQSRRVGGSPIGGATFMALCKLLLPRSKRDRTPSELVSICAGGDNSRCDMLVSDIYGGDYTVMGLPGHLIASTMGKLQHLGRSKTRRSSTPGTSRNTCDDGPTSSSSTLFSHSGTCCTMSMASTNDLNSSTSISTSPGVGSVALGETLGGGELVSSDVCRSLLTMTCFNIAQLAYFHSVLEGINRIAVVGVLLDQPGFVAAFQHSINFWSKGQCKVYFFRSPTYLSAIGAWLRS